MSDPKDVLDPEQAGANGESSGEETGVELAPGQAEPARDAASLERECSELRDQLLRRRAEFENYKRRVERDRLQAGVDAVVDLLKATIPTLDHLELALQAPSSDGALREGLVLIQRGLLGALEGRGLSVEDPLLARFDPERHQAVSYEESTAVADGSVLRVLGKGYLFKDRLLRPALVIVARGPQPETDGKSDPDAVH